MINLLPPDTKSHYRYALLNVRMRHWLIASCLALAGLVVIGGFGWLYMHQISGSYTKQINDTTTTLQSQNLDKTQQEVKTISGSLKLAVQVLSKEVLFSKLLKQLAAVTPRNAVLSTLNITQGDSAVDITAQATDYNAATQLQVNLADPNNKIFSKADIVNISCSSTGGSSDGINGKYPCTITIRALFSNSTSFLFIHNEAKL